MPRFGLLGLAVLSLAVTLTPAALADEIAPPVDAWLIQGTAYPVLVENLTGLWADAPPVPVGHTKMCNVRFVMQPGRLTQTSFGKCLGGLQESMEGFLQGMFFWPPEGADTAEPNGAGVKVTLMSKSYAIVVRLEAEPGTPFLKDIDGERVSFNVWEPAYPRTGPRPEPSKKAAKAIGDATCTLTADVDTEGVGNNWQLVDCPDAAHKSALKAAGEWAFEPLKLDDKPYASTADLTLTYTAPK